MKKLILVLFFIVILSTSVLAMNENVTYTHGFVDNTVSAASNSEYANGINFTLAPSNPEIFQLVSIGKWTTDGGQFCQVWNVTFPTTLIARAPFINNVCTLSNYSIYMSEETNLYITATHTASDVRYYNGAGLPKTTGHMIWHHGTDPSHPFSTAGYTRIYSIANITFFNTTAAETPIGNFSITALNARTNAALTNFNATIIGVDYVAVQNNISTTIPKNSSSLFNIIIRHNNSHFRYYPNYNVSINLVANLEPYYYTNVTAYTNFTEYSGTNYTRKLFFTSSLRCPDFATTGIDIYINNTINSNISITCNNNTVDINGSYQHGTETAFNIEVYLNTSHLPEINNGFYSNGTFLSDLYNPQVIINRTITNGFNQSFLNTTLTCIDNVTPLLTYNHSLNSVNLFYANLTSGTPQSNKTIMEFGTNNITGICRDFFGQSEDTFNQIIYFNLLALIDEKENAPFNLDNASSVRVYYDDNSTFYDFKTNGVTEVNFTTIGTSKLRFEFVYESDVTITRYIDLSLLEREVRICINKEGVTHFQQLILSSLEKAVIVRNIFANCLVAADYTRFAYQDAKLLRALTIDSLYSLTVISDGVEVLLASIDGSIASFINIDTLEFQATETQLNVLQETLTFERFAQTIIKIFYRDIENNNEDLTATIINMDTNSVVFTGSDFANPNNFTIFFDYSTVANVSNSTIFKINLDIIENDGTEETVTKFFNIIAQSGNLYAGFAFVISLLIMVFGLTFTISRLTFSWFGLFMMIASISVLTFSAPAWYITFLMALEVIITIFIGITMVQKNYPTVA